MYRNNSESFDENYDDDEDIRGDLPYAKSYSKRSKRRSDDDEYRKPSRKSKNRSRSKRNKLPPTYEESLHDSTELNTTRSTEIPKGEGPLFSALTPPISPAPSTKRTKASTNLFENTPKIKIGEVRSGNTKISKLGRKILEVVHLDWRTPYTHEDAPVIKSPLDSSDIAYSVGNHIRNQYRSAESLIRLDPHNSGSILEASESREEKNIAEKVQVFADYDTVQDRKTELLYFVANNIESLLTMPTKIEITLTDFKTSALGSKVRQRLEVMTTIMQAKELGLILEDQFASKQKQFLDAFSFGMDNLDKKA
jgi:hypothetical protein